MVNLSATTLSRTFSALADPTRRALVARLGAGQAAVSELARPFVMSLPAVMKHLDVLADAGLVTREKQGRVVVCTLDPAPLEGAMSWLEAHRRFWDGSLDKLEARAVARARGRAPRGEGR